MSYPYIDKRGREWWPRVSLTPEMADAMQRNTPNSTPGKITSLERAVVGSCKVYDQISEPLVALRDLLISLGFKALRKLRRK